MEINKLGVHYLEKVLIDHILEVKGKLFYYLRGFCLIYYFKHKPRIGGVRGLSLYSVLPIGINKENSKLSEKKYNDAIRRITKQTEYKLSIQKDLDENYIEFRAIIMLDEENIQMLIERKFYYYKKLFNRNPP
jgi:hypothetical protein